MYKLLKILHDFKNYFVFIGLIVISFSLISFSSSSEIGGFRTLIVTTLGIIQEKFNLIPNTNALLSENKSLTELNLRLSSEVITMHKAKQENEELRAMLTLINDKDVPLEPVEVVQKSTVQMRNYVVVNKGIKDGIKVGMAVRSAAGLVGTIIGISDNYSIVELLNNRSMKIPAKLVDNECEGIIVWEGEEYLLLKNISKSIDVRPGEMVVTSSFSSKFPHNIPIGVVAKVIDEPGSHFSKIVVRPVSKFFNFDYLFIMKIEPAPEIQKIIDEIETKVYLMAKQRKS